MMPGVAGSGVCEHLLRPASPEGRDLVGGALVLPLRGRFRSITRQGPSTTGRLQRARDITVERDRNAIV